MVLKVSSPVLTFASRGGGACGRPLMAAAYKPCREEGRSMYKYGDGVEGGVGWGLSATVPPLAPRAARGVTM